jgi:hypothetical protein
MVVQPLIMQMKTKQVYKLLGVGVDFGFVCIGFSTSEIQGEPVKAASMEFRRSAY